MRCGDCTGSGSCDPCDGYGTLPDSAPNAGDGPDCEMCDATGECVFCAGTGEIDEKTDTDEILEEVSAR